LRYSWCLRKWTWQRDFLHRVFHNWLSPKPPTYLNDSNSTPSLAGRYCMYDFVCCIAIAIGKNPPKCTTPTAHIIQHCNCRWHWEHTCLLGFDTVSRFFCFKIKCVWIYETRFEKHHILNENTLSRFFKIKKQSLLLCLFYESNYCKYCTLALM